MDQLFKENQSLLLELVNTEAGRLLLGKLGYKPKNLIVNITQNSFIEFLGIKDNKAILSSTHFSKHPIYKLFAPALSQMEIVSQTKYRDQLAKNRYEAFLHFTNLERSKHLPLILLENMTFNPTSGSSSPVDGYVGRTGVNEAFGTIRASAGTTFSNSATSSNDTPQLLSTSTLNQYQSLLRNIYCFDTSTVPAAAKISSVAFNLFAPAASEKSNQLGSPDLHISSATPAATNTLANSDFSNVGTTSFANITYSNWTANQYNSFTLSQAGIANVSTTGISKFSTQLSWDINNSFAGTWAGLSQSAFRANFSDNGSNLPQLVITYSIPAGDFKFL